MPPRAQSPDQRSTLDHGVGPKLTTLERERLKFWMAHLPEVIAGHCSKLASKRGFAGSVGHLVDVLEFASSELDRVALHIVMEGAARRLRVSRSLGAILPRPRIGESAARHELAQNSLGLALDLIGR